MKVELNGKMVEADRLGIKAEPEPWIGYTLSDGSTHRLRCSLVGVVRVHGEYWPNGDPVYQPQFDIQFRPDSIPDALRKDQPILGVIAGGKAN